MILIIRKSSVKKPRHRSLRYWLLQALNSVYAMQCMAQKLLGPADVNSLQELSKPLLIMMCAGIFVPFAYNSNSLLLPLRIQSE